MFLDQVHEQNNETVKDAGAAVGLLENYAALKRSMVAGPEQARILSEFEDIVCTPDQHTLNHEQEHASQETFKKQVTNMCDVVVTMGNTFMDSSNELMTLDIHDCMNETVAQALHSMERLGKEQYSKYVNDVLIERKTSIHKAIKKNQLPYSSVVTSLRQTQKQNKSFNNTG